MCAVGPNHRLSLLPALPHLRDHVAVQGPRDVDKWAELGHHRQNCALLKRRLRAGKSSRTGG